MKIIKVVDVIVLLMTSVAFGFGALAMKNCLKYWRSNFQTARKQNK